MNNRPSNISIHNLVKKRSLGKSVKDLGNFRLKFCAETTALSLVPDLHISKVKLSGTTDMDFKAQRSSRSSRFFTSCQGLWSSGLHSMSASRASSSALSASVTGRSSAESESQTAPMNSRRSAGLRLTTLAIRDSSIMGVRIAQKDSYSNAKSPGNEGSMQFESDLPMNFDTCQPRWPLIRESNSAREILCAGLASISASRLSALAVP